MKTLLFIYGVILCYLVYNIEVKIKELPQFRNETYEAILIDHEKEINALEKKVK